MSNRSLSAAALALVLTSCAGGTPAPITSTPATTTDVAPVTTGVLPTTPSTAGTTPAIPTPAIPPLFSVPDASRHAWTQVVCVEGHAVSVIPDTPDAWSDAVKYCESTRRRSSTSS